MKFLFTIAFSKRKLHLMKYLNFVEDEQFKYLVSESINDNYYGFNLKNKLERKPAKDCVGQLDIAC